MATNKEKLIGSRLGNLIRNGVSNIPDNKATRAFGTLANVVNASVHRNPLSRLYTNAENFVVDKGASLAEKHLKIDPLIAQMGIGFAIPGPGGEVKTAKKVLKGSKASEAIKIAENTKELAELFPKKLKINGTNGVNGGNGGNGAAKQLLEIENANAEKALLQKNRKIPSDSTISSITSDVTDELVYGRGTKKIKASIPKELGGKLDTLTQIKGVPNKEFHHVFMKDLSAEYAEKARELVRQGKATPEDVIMLDRIAKKYGFGLGDYKTAGIYSDRIPHSAGHKRAIELGIQPSPAGPGPDLDTTKLKIKKTSDIKELFASFEDSIKEIAIPMKDEIEGFQEAWEKIDVSDRYKLIELRLERKALRKPSTTDLKSRYRERVKVETQYEALKKKLQKEMGVIRNRLDEVKIQKKDIEIDNLHSAFAG
mgnify:CR=1 FL=1|tara:strand:+ start:218 stop:1495 length:1278 start_codon:yes stop_codon:yes gene_type:complete